MPCGAGYFAARSVYLYWIHEYFHYEFLIPDFRNFPAFNLRPITFSLAKAAWSVYKTHDFEELAQSIHYSMKIGENHED